MQKRGLAERKRSPAAAVALRLVKLQRPPPEMRIFSPGRRGVVEDQHRRPRLPASIGAHQPGGAGAEHHDIEAGNHVRRRAAGDGVRPRGFDRLTMRAEGGHHGRRVDAMTAEGVEQRAARRASRGTRPLS